MRRNQDREPLGRDALEQLVKLDFFTRIQSGRGLVEQQQRRIGGESTRDLDQALMTIGKARNQLVGTCAKSDKGERGHGTIY